MARMRFEIEADSGGVSLPIYNTATFKLMQLLREIDSAISGKTGGIIGWYVIDLAKNGTLGLEVESRLKKPPKRYRDRQTRDTAPAVTQSFVTGFENLEVRGISPPYLSEHGLEKMLSMMDLLHKNGAKGFIATSVEDHRSVAVTERAARTLRELLPPRREEKGSVEGTLETISIHRRKTLIIYDSLSHKGVTCILPKEEPLKQATEALGKKVVISGLVCFNIKDEPVKIVVGNLRVLGLGKQLPTAAQLTGSDPDFTGDLTTDEYIERIRRG